MTKNLLLKSTSVRSGLGINSVLLWYIALDYFHAPGWAFGVMFAVYALIVLNFIVQFFNCHFITLEEVIKGATK
jgi:hypothetical protein